MEKPSKTKEQPPSSDFEINNRLVLLAKSSFIVSITLLLSKFLLYLYRIVIARQYGPEVYGLFTLSVVIISWFRIFASLGIKEGLLRYIPLIRARKQDKAINYIVEKSFFLLIITTVLASILLFFFSDAIAIKLFSNSNLTIFLQIFSVALPFIIFGAVFLSIIRAFERIGWFSFISNILGNLIQLVILGILIFFGMNSLSIPISYFIGTFAIFISAYVIFREVLPRIKNKERNNPEHKKLFKETLSYSWPCIFYGIVNYFFYWTDSFLIGIFKSVQDVGFYNAAVPIAALLALPYSLFGQLFFPMVTKAFSKGDSETVKQLSQQVGKWVFMIVMPFFVLFMIFPGVFINILFGPEYLVAENALRFLVLGSLFAAIFGISQDLLFIKGKSKLVLIDTLIIAVINVILCVILIPLYGLNGASFATMLSLIILYFIFFIQSYKHFSIIPVRRKMLNITFIVILLAIPLWLIRSFVKVNLFSLIMGGIFFGALYISLIFLTHCLDKNDLSVLKSIWDLLKKFKKNPENLPKEKI